ncbi:MAG: hypothetical protein H6713_17440 [Myxococcales bacterium]|nr:hypothetical protein [Myxococcales bacterium]
MHEAWAAWLAGWSARRAERAPLRSIHGQLVHDELAHAELAWSRLTWFYEQLPPHGRRRLQGALQEALAGLPARARAQARRLPSALGLPAPDVLARAVADVQARLEAQARALGLAE